MSVKAEPAKQLRLLRFYLGADCYSMETSSVWAIRRWEEMLPPLDETSGSIASVRVGKGLAPVYSLGDVLGLDVAPDPGGPVFVVASASQPYGVQVDRVARAVSTAFTEPRQLPLLARDPLGKIRGVARLDGEVSLVLSGARLIGGTGQEAAFAAPGNWGVPVPPRSQKKLLCFSDPNGASGTRFAFSLRQVVEIVEGVRVIRLGSDVPSLHGLIDWRGYMVPVVESQSLLGIPGWRSVPTGTKFAILRGTRSQELFAMAAEDIAAVTLPLPTEIGAALSGFGPYIRAGFAMAGGPLVLPDLDGLAAGE